MRQSINQCAFSIIFFKLQSYYIIFDMMEMAKSDGDSLYGSLKKCLSDKNIPLSNMVGF